jgi:integrase
MGLDWQRVDRKAGIVRLDVGARKNHDGREFSYRDIPDVKDMIERQLAAHEALKKNGTICPLVFQRKGKPIRSFRKAWRAACKAASCPGRLLHDCRRTAVRNLERAGVSRSVAMKLTGHKTEAVFRRYAIVSSGDLAEASRKLQAMTGIIVTAGTKGRAGTGSDATGTISGTIGQSDAASEMQKASA